MPFEPIKPEAEILPPERVELPERALRAAVISAYQISRNVTVISRKFGVPGDQVKRWVREGDAGIQATWDHVREELSNKLTAACNAALDALPEKLADGKTDARELAMIVDKTGNLLLKLREQADIRVQNTVHEIVTMPQSDLHARVKQFVMGQHAISEAQAEAFLEKLIEDEAGKVLPGLVEDDRDWRKPKIDRSGATGDYRVAD